MEERVRSALRDQVRVSESFGSRYAAAIVAVARDAAQSLAKGGKVLAFGNGGSAADAQHLAAELVNRFRIDRPPLAGLALTTDSSALTAIGNDFGFDRVFEKQVRALARPGDVSVGFTTSGTSPNVLLGLGAAREIGCVCVGLTGQNVTPLAEICDHLFYVPSRDTPRIQECHIFWVHMFCELIDEILFPGTPS